MHAVKSVLSPEDELRAIGFHEVDGLLSLGPKHSPLDVAGVVVPKIAFLKTLGFSRPIRLIEMRPAIVFMDSESLREKILRLRKMGFSNPIRMIENFPTLVGYDLESNVPSKIESLKAAGFNNALGMIEMVPSIIGINLQDRVSPQLQHLRELGFSDPILLIERRPNILYLSVSGKIVPQIESLKTIGFIQPLRMIERRPGLLTLNFERNIRPTVDELLRWGYSLKQIESRPSQISLSLSRMTAIRQFLESLNFDVKTLNPVAKRRILNSLTYKDIAINFERHEIFSPTEKVSMLADISNWEWIFAKAA